MFKLNYTAIKVIAFVPTMLFMMNGMAMPSDAKTIENNYINQSVTKQTQTLLLAKGGKDKAKGAEHTSNKSPSNLEKHQNGQAAKKQQASNKKFNEAKGKNSHVSKDSLRTNGSKSR